MLEPKTNIFTMRTPRRCPATVLRDDHTCGAFRSSLVHSLRAARVRHRRGEGLLSPRACLGHQARTGSLAQVGTYFRYPSRASTLVAFRKRAPQRRGSLGSHLSHWHTDAVEHAAYERSCCTPVEPSRWADSRGIRFRTGTIARARC